MTHNGERLPSGPPGLRPSPRPSWIFHHGAFSMLCNGDKMLHVNIWRFVDLGICLAGLIDVVGNNLCFMCLFALCLLIMQSLIRIPSQTYSLVAWICESLFVYYVLLFVADSGSDDKCWWLVLGGACASPSCCVMLCVVILPCGSQFNSVVDSIQLLATHIAACVVFF